MRGVIKQTFFILLSTAVTLFAQRTTLDWKVHNVGKVRQLITNMGALWAASTDYPGLIYCEYPPNSHEEHIGEAGIWVGAITPENDTLVSATTIWADPHFEFYPSAAPDDTIWVVNKGDTVNIPYWGQYTAIADQDFVCRYSDYYLTNIGDHRPLYLDVIQISHAWSSYPLDEMIVFEYYVIPTRKNLSQVYIAYWMDGNVGYRGEGWGFALDDLSFYYADRNLAASIDPPTGEDEAAISPLGVKLYPSSKIPPASLRWTFNWYPGGGAGGPADRDNVLYQEISAGTIMRNQQAGDGSQFILSYGPLTLAVGDTAYFRVGLILGEGEAKMLANADRLDWLVQKDFKVPAPPPLPPLRLETRSHEITLRWKPLPGDVDPESYRDPNRADNASQPFEGYRVYKSTRSKTGPWTLLAEYDVPANQFFLNTGLQYEYTDIGLLNNLEYYYTVTAFSKPDAEIDFPSQESSKNANAKLAVPGTAAPATVGEVAVVPNPYRGDIAYHAYNPAWEKPTGTRDRWMEQDRRIQFINLPANCEIKIYSLAGDWIATIAHNNPQQGYEDWNLTSAVGQAIASGIYLFTVEDMTNGKVQIGKFVVIK
ncbi:MAG: hypothetical protein ONB16_00110 [candidate division KSB1 bacterium]|nr:hypothetical protein [candidate division KSB1 bacterium]MDZ7340287.1 hypothetical protein [candidate division KSB1 bacterium]